MLKLNILPRNRKAAAVLAGALPFAVAFVYWFAMVGVTDPATRLKKEIEGNARRALIGRTPLTFVHHPINQWTRPVRDFYLRIERDGSLYISYGDLQEGYYHTQVDEPAGVAGHFEIRRIGSGVEIELIPGGDTADVASLTALP